jgi:hypothetical protein
MEDFRLSFKLIFVLILVVIGILAWLFRKFFSVRNASQQKSIIKKLTADQSLAAGFSEGIDMPYGKADNCSVEQFRQLGAEFIRAKDTFPIPIDYVQLISDSKILVLTHIDFSDHVIGVTPGSADEKARNYHNYVIHHDPVKQQALIFSDMHATTDEKLQKESFATAVLKMKK